MTVPRGTASRLRFLIERVKMEASRQNLVAASTLDDIYRRHIGDSLQIAPLLRGGAVLDIGSGAGFPGAVLACLSRFDVTLVEPRRKRAEFLEALIAELGLSNARVVRSRVETLPPADFANVTARAVMSLSRLFEAASRQTTETTRWILPKGRTADSELADALETWQGEFELVASRTDPDARIVIAEGVRRRGG